MEAVMFNTLREDASHTPQPIFSDDQSAGDQPESPSVASDQSETPRRRMSLKSGKRGRFGFGRWVLLALVVVVCVYMAFTTITGMINDAFVAGTEVGISQGINLGRLLEKCEKSRDPLACQAVLEITAPE
jgi:hypothetical protein